MRTIIICFLLISLSLIGCGRSSSGMNPLTPASPDHEANASMNSHVLWGIWNVEFIPTGQNTADVNVVPLRAAEFNANVQRFLTPAASPINLITFQFLPESNFPGGYVKVRVSLRHPFPGLPIFRGFDTRCIFMADANDIGIHDPAISYNRPLLSGQPSTGAYMLNPDGYTRWWNYPEFTDPTPLFSFKPSPLGIDPKPEATLNPFKYFSDDLDPDEPLDMLDFDLEGSFGTSGNANTRIYEIQFPVSPKNFRFNLAVDASWAKPDPAYAPNYPLESFPKEAHTQEAFLVEGEQTGGDAFYVDSASGGSIELAVTVFDWQGKINPGGVSGEVKSIWLEGGPLAAPVDILPTAIEVPGPEPLISATWQVELDNSLLDITSAGDFILLGTVESTNPSTYMPQVPGGSSYKYPGAPLAAYFTMTVNVTSNVPSILVISPNGGEYLLVGSSHNITWTGADVFDTVTIQYSKDNFVSDINTIIDFTENDGEFLWDGIPDDPSDTVLIRIFAFDAPSITDQSDAYFTIGTEGPEERIVYRGDGPSAGMHIYSIDPEGIGPAEQWTFGTEPAFRENAKLSPCGKYIMYTFCDMAVGEIRLIDVVTKVETTVNPPGKQALYGDFSHDGTKIVCAAADVWYGPFELWTVDYTGGNAQQLTDGADPWSPEFNIDDTSIYYSEFSTSNICIYDVASGNITQYTDNGTWNDDPVGSIDGKYIAWSTMYNNSCRYIYISPLSGWNPPDKILAFDDCARTPHYSPDGTRLVFDHGKFNESNLAIYNLATDEWHDITSNSYGEYMADWGIMVPH